MVSALHLIALKLHSYRSPTRRDKSTDWNDVVELIHVSAIRLDDPDIRAMLSRYGGDGVVDRFLDEVRDAGSSSDQ